MGAAFNKRLFFVWLVLSGITMTYLAIDHTADHHRAEASTAATLSAVALALVKVRIIMREFMEVRSAPAWLRRLTDLLVVLMATGLLAAYLVGKSVA